VGAFIKPSDPPTLSSLFTSAAKFHNVLTISRCIDPQTSESSESEGSIGFTDLVGRDLDSSEHAAAANIARLRATQYSWGSNGLSADPESYQDDKSDEGDEKFLASPTGTPESEESDSENFKLEPAQIVDILVEEFGPLASDDETESLVIESDGCMIAQDVFIVGVIHVTTHRLTFHASLLSTQSKVSPHHVIKAGPAVIHRKGWRSKRRVWMELSHDMVCIYTSNKGDAKTRPLGTLLLAFISKLLPLIPSIQIMFVFI